MFESLEAWFSKEKTALGNTLPQEIENGCKRLEALEQTIAPLVANNVALTNILTIALARIQTLEKLCNIVSAVVTVPAPPTVAAQPVTLTPASPVGIPTAITPAQI